MASRISTPQLYQRTQTGVQEAQARVGESARKSATLKEIDRPSQDATGWVRAKGIRDELSVNDQIAKNAEMAMHFLTATEQSLARVQEYVQSTHENALKASDDLASSNAAWDSILSEVKALYDSTLQALNSRFSNRTLLGGYQSKGVAFNEMGEFVGDSGEINLEVQRGIQVPINIDAQQAILGKGLINGTDIIGTFKQLISGLEKQDKEELREVLPNFYKAIDQLSVFRTQIATSMSQIERSLKSNADDRVEKLDTAAKIDEADPVKVFTDLARDQTTLTAVMSTAEKLLRDLPKDLPF